MRRLLLWDIDGTLLHAGGVSREAFHDAVHQVLGTSIDDSGLRFDGRTDPQIARELLSGHGVPPDEIDLLMRKVLRRFGPAFASRKNQLYAAGRVCPGVPEALEACAERDALSTLLTGNLAVNAVLKLDTFRLTSHFDLEIGAYGSDREDRLDLVDVVLDRMQRQSLHFEDDEIWIIGDTPADLATARENDVRCLLVATGNYELDDLAALNPDALLENLSDLNGFLTAIGWR